MLSKIRMLSKVVKAINIKPSQFNFCNKTEVQDNKIKLLKTNLMGSKLKERFENLDETSFEELKEKAKIFDFTLLQDNKSNINKMELVRNIDDWMVRIIFNAPKYQSKFPGEVDKEDILKEYVESASLQIPVYIIIKRENKPKGFFISGVINEGQLSIEYINCTENVEEYHKLFVRAYIHRDHQAFDFDILDQELQDRFVNFINELGVEQGLIDLIEEISETKEKSLYVNWYNTFKNIVSDKH